MTDRQKILKLAWPALRVNLKTYVLVSVLTISVAILMVFDPVVFGRMVDVIVDALGAGDTSNIMRDIVPLLVIWIGIFVFNTLAGILGRYIFWKTHNDTSTIFVRSISHDMLRWSQQRYADLESGRALKVLDDAWEGIWKAMDSIFENMLPAFVSFTAVVVIGFTIDWRLTLVSMVMLPVSVGMGVHAWKKVRPRQDKLHKAWGRVSRHLSESITNISAVQNYAQENQREKGLLKLLTDVVNRQLNINVFWAIFHGLGDTVTLLGRVIVFILGIVLVSKGMVTIGILITFLGMLTFLLTPIQYAISQSLPRVLHAWSSFKLLADLVYQENDVIEKEGAKKLNKVYGNIEIDGVTFRYKDHEDNTIRNVSMNIPDGTSCAIIGPSGAGKTTLARLINRSLDPTRGKIELDGKDIREYTLQSLRSKIGVVTQDTLLFHDTVLNNVRFVRPGASLDDVKDACKKAQAHGFISKLPKGYESIVGERGVKLSGGEKQRIALARIFLADTPILVLDESTSALDSETESKLQQAILKVMKGRTTIVIAHRLSTIYMADQIVVMKNGRVEDVGTHDELMEKGGLYDRLWSLQSGGYIK